MTVSLVLAEALTKTGIADGDIYEKTSFVSKWFVVCSEPSSTVARMYRWYLHSIKEFGGAVHRVWWPGTDAPGSS
jgi:hypothetical protein